MTAKEKLVPELRFPEFTDEWEKKKLGEGFEFIKSYSYSRSDEGNGHYFHIHYGDIHSLYRSYIDSRTIIPSIVSSKNHIKLEEGDLIIADASEDYDDLGKCVLLKESNNRKIIGGLHTFVLRSYGKIIPEYFLYYTKTDKYKRNMNRLGTGTSVYGINKKNYFSIQVSLPSTSEQQKIGDFLYTIDQKLELQRKKIEELKNYKKGMIQRIFDQEIRFKDEDGNEYPEWEEKRLGEVSHVQGGYAFNSKEYKDSGIAIVRISNIDDSVNLKENVVFTKNRNIKEEYCIKNGDLLIAMSGATTGKTGIYKYKKCSYLNQRCGKFIGSDKLYYAFLYAWVKTSEFKSQLNTRLIAGAQPNISKLDIESIKIKLPSLLEQEKIANFLSALDKKIELEENKLSEYEEYKKGLMQRMFI